MRIRISVWPEDYPDTETREFRIEKVIGSLELAYAKKPLMIIQDALSGMVEKVMEEITNECKPTDCGTLVHNEAD